MRAALLVGAVSLVVAACGSDDSGGGGGGGSAGAGGEAKSAKSTETWSIPGFFIDCEGAGVTKGCNGPAKEGTYKSLSPADVSKPWRLCYLVPHLNDPIWVASDYAAVTEAKRLGINLDVLSAGGYTEIAKQNAQMENCAVQGADGILLGAVDGEALNPKIQELVGDGKVVIDAGNGVTSTTVSGHALTDYYNMGHSVGEQVASSGKAMNVVVLPGPAGVGWSERSAQGFKDAIKGTQVKVVATKYGNTAREVQLKLVENLLGTYDNLDAIIGTAVTTDVAAPTLEQRKLNDKIKLYATYLIPSTLEQIKSGKVACAPTEQPNVTVQIAMDMAIRLLEKKPLEGGVKRASPRPTMACGPAAGDGADNVADFDTATSFAPEGFKPVFRVKN